MPYTMNDYTAARSAGDFPNAVAVWDALAEANDAFLRRRFADRFNPGLPALFASFMPQSGGEILAHRMAETLGYVEFHWAVSRPDIPTEIYPAPSAVDVYARGGYFCRTQARPTPFLRMIMTPRMTTPFWVHVRHPAETCREAWEILIRSLPQPAVPPAPAPAPAATPAAPSVALKAESSRSSRKSGRARPADPPADPPAAAPAEPPPPPPPPPAAGPRWEDYFAANIATHVGWIDAWVDYATEYPGRVVFSTWDEMGNINSLLTRVFARYGFAVDFTGVPETFPDSRRPTDPQADWRAALGADQANGVAAADAAWARVRELAALPAKDA